MNKEDCLCIAQGFNPKTVKELIDDAQCIHSWLLDESFGSHDVEIKSVHPSAVVIPFKPKDTKQNDDELVKDKNEILDLIRFFILGEGIEPKIGDLIEAGVCPIHIHSVLTALETDGLIKRVNLHGYKTVIRLLEAA